MKSALLSIWLLLLLAAVAFAQWGGGYGTAPGGGGGTVTGGTGCNTVGSSLLKGSGTGGCANAVAGTDYAAPPAGSTILKGNGAGGFSSAAAGTDYAPPTSGTAILAGNNAGGFNSAVSGTDYAPATSGNAILRANGIGGFSPTAAGVDYAPATPGTGILKANGAGGFNSATAGIDYPPVPAASCGQDGQHACGYNVATNNWTNQQTITIPAGPPGAFQWNNGGSLGGTAVTGLVKGNGAGAPSAAAAGTDYAPATSGSAILKGNGAGGFAAAAAGTDYAPATSGSAILKGNGAGGFAAATAGTDYAPATVGAANLPLFTNGAGGHTTGTVSGNTTEVATFSGAATAARCLHTDGNGNVAVTASDCAAGSGGVPGYLNTPTVTASGGNSTTTLLAQCSLVGCTDYNSVVNGANAGTLTITPPASTGMTAGALFWVAVKEGATIPTDVLFGAAPSGVTYQSYVLGLSAADLTSTAAGEAAKRANACGAPAVNGTLAYQFWWDGTNLNLMGCAGNSPASALSVALGGTQCGPAGLMSTLPAAPVEGTICSVTNAGTCIAGTALNTAVTGTTHCQVVYLNGAWQPAGGSIAPTSGGLTSAGIGLVTNGSQVNLITPVAAANGGAGTVNGVLKANGAGVVSAAASGTDFQAPIPSAAASPSVWLTGFTAPGTFTTKRPASTDLSDLPIPPSSGGDGCAQTPGLTYSALPASPVFGTSCFITDCKTGIAGTGEIGGGTIPCEVSYMGATCASAPNCWIDGGLAAQPANAGNGVTIQLANDSTNPPMVNQLASVSGTNTAILTPVAAASGIQGVCIAGCNGSGGSSANATIQTQGSVKCTFVGAVTPGDYAEIAQGAGNAGKCQDATATPAPGVTLVGTIINPAAGGAGTYNINLFGPDVIAAAGTGAIQAPAQTGNPMYYGSNTKTGYPVSNIIYIGAYKNASPDPLHAAQAACPNNVCTLVGTPGDNYTVPSPFWLGMGLAGPYGPNALSQTLLLNGAHITFTDSTNEGGFPVDDGLIIGGRARVYCRHTPSGGILTGIGSSGSSYLNSVITSPAGVIENVREVSHPYKIGQVIKDPNLNTEYATTTGNSSATATNSIAWPTTVGNTVVDGGVTWEEIVAGALNSSGQEWELEGCAVAGPGHTNNVVSIRGVNGGKIRMYDDDVATLGGETDGGSNGDLLAYNGGTQGGSVGIRVDPGQTHGFCTGSGAPLACCTGPNAGSCDAITGTPAPCCGEINGTFLGPGAQVNNGPSAGIYINSAAFIRVLNSQWADIGGSNNIALAVVKNSTAITFENNYFETDETAGVSQQGVGSDQLQIYDTNNFTSLDNFFGRNGGTGSRITNCLHITGSSQSKTFYVHLQGQGNSGVCNTFIKNDWNQNDNVVGGAAFDFFYTNLAATTPEPMLLSALQLSGYMSSGNCTGPGAPLPCCTAAGAGNCVAALSGGTMQMQGNPHAMICAADADACTPGTTYSNTGAHGTSCFLVQNNAGTSWVETGARCG